MTAGEPEQVGRRNGGRHRAVVATGAFPDEPLRGLGVIDVESRAPRKGETRVSLRAAALNHHDLWTLRGVGAVKLEYPRVMGSDGAGDDLLVYPVLRCGDPERCHGCRVGDASLCRRASLVGESRDGTLAPSVVVPDENLVPVPRGLSVEEAACLPSAYLTAWNQLTRAAGVGSGDTVLVTGATGGMGVAAIQLGRALGARMVAQVRRPDVADDLRALGADTVVMVHEDVRSVLGGEVDVVLENLGAATWSASLRAVRPGGAIVVSGATTGSNPPADLQRIFWRQLRVVGASMGSIDDLRALVEFVQENAVKPAVAAVFPLEEARSAFSKLSRGRVLGKVVVRVG